MKYKLINSPNNKYNAKQQILINRGIKEEELDEYMNLTDEVISSPEDFGIEKLKKGSKMIERALEIMAETCIIIDCDCDGYTSSSIFINYLHDLNSEWVENHVHWFMHEGKQHGLQDCMDWIEDINPQLVLIPDAGSNDYDQLKILTEAGKDIIILDHHEIEGEPFQGCVLINSQLPPYKNGELSGAGVVYQFCRYLDYYFGVNFADKYLDLCALGLVGDMMSLKSMETRRLINKGLYTKNIRNPFIYAMWQKNKFKLGDNLTAWGETFYIVPLVNAITRSGTQQEKELIFKSMLEFEAYKDIPSNKRGHKIGEVEKLVDQAMRTCTNVKNRQTRAETQGLELVESLIEKNNMMEHKVLLFLLEPGQIKAEIRG